MNAGGVAAIIDYLGDTRGQVRLPGIMVLGYVGAHTETLGMAVIVSKGVSQLAIIMQEESDDKIRAATVWSLGQIGSHTPEHAKALATVNVLPRLLEAYTSPHSSEDLQLKAKKGKQTLYMTQTNHTLSFEKRPPKGDLLTCVGALVARCTGQHPQVCRRSVQQGKTRLAFEK